MAEFKIGDKVKVIGLWYSGFELGSTYNLPRSVGTVCEVDPHTHIPQGYIKIEYGDGVISPPVNPSCFELVEEAIPHWLEVLPARKETKYLKAAYAFESDNFNPGLFIKPIYSEKGAVEIFAVPYATVSQRVGFFQAEGLRRWATEFNKLADKIDEIKGQNE